MEKRLYTPQPLILCTCGNQLLLAPGCACEVCMGIATDVMEAPSSTSGERRDRFDMSYFEALERMFESFEFAA